MADRSSATREKNACVSQVVRTVKTLLGMDCPSRPKGRSQLSKTIEKLRSKK
jgi:hypothetical protein